MNDRSHSLREIGLACVMIAAGGVLALAPLTFQAVAARSLSLGEQGLLAVGLGVGAYAGQVIGAWVVDARLATMATAGCIPFPRTLLVAAVLAAMLVLADPRNGQAIAVGAAVLLAALVVGRLVAVTQEQHFREVLACIALASGISVAAGHGFDGDSALRALVSGCLASILLRYVPVASERVASRRARAWVTAEATLTGMAQPAVNALLLTLVGPSVAIAFRAISSVSGAVEPALSYARARLLVRVSPVQVGSAAGIIAALVVLILTIDLAGAWDALLEDAWARVTLLALVLACSWRAAALLSTGPFAALRRRGSTVLVFWLRAVSTVLYLGLAIPATLTGRIEALFLALLLAELLTALGYYVAERCQSRQGAAMSDTHVPARRPAPRGAAS